MRLKCYPKITQIQFSHISFFIFVFELEEGPHNKQRALKNTKNHTNPNKCAHLLTTHKNKRQSETSSESNFARASHSHSHFIIVFAFGIWNNAQTKFKKNRRSWIFFFFCFKFVEYSPLRGTWFSIRDFWLPQEFYLRAESKGNSSGKYRTFKNATFF